jgi:anti-sigma B factor antagonist
VASIEQNTHTRRINQGLLTIEVGPEIETCLVRAVGELDLATVAALENELSRLLSSDLQRVVLDLGELTFVDSVGLVCLVNAARRSSRDGDRLRMLPAADETVNRTLRLTGLDQVLPLID